ncbi:hypothetical protein BKA58DRAFT_460678 [Alternaria rosae]|uniref:uncharacterized protein n=1 Tax=Alternaria rosae TaxID=1187941 RepID=UPI001E8DB10E|nr:uncharacterized protein BKA58DRAFT_460678 [Alternaria rosae]KAH6866830.1 hypothetical protein BKA58DRAFT_460678 [Alternaria rosae]
MYFARHDYNKDAPLSSDSSSLDNNGEDHGKEYPIDLHVAMVRALMDIKRKDIGRRMQQHKCTRICQLLIPSGRLCIVDPRERCCFQLAGEVIEVDRRSVKVRVKREKTPNADGWEKEFTVELSEYVQEPAVGASCVFKGHLEQFTPVFKAIKFIAEICKKVEESSS